MKVDSQPGSFDYDDPSDYEEWCDWNDVDVEEGYYDPFPAGCGMRVYLSRECFRDGHRYCSCCFGRVRRGAYGFTNFGIAGHL